jgi:hypothetical protein
LKKGLQLAAVVVPFLLRRDPRLRLALDLALPLAIEHGPRAVAFARRRAGAWKIGSAVRRNWKKLKLKR